MREDYQLYIFISHTSKDDQIVNRITKIFDEYHIPYFVDHNHPFESKAVYSTIDLHFKKSTDFLLIWSDNVDSEYVNQEINAANSEYSKKKSICLY